MAMDEKRKGHRLFSGARGANREGRRRGANGQGVSEMKSFGKFEKIEII